MVEEKASAKVNLCLQIVGQKSNGFHLLDSIVGFTEFGDHLSFKKSDKLELRVQGAFSDQIPVDRSNLILEAAELVRKLNNIKTKFIISIAGSTFEEYQSVLKTIESANGEHVGYEINVSCPNVKAGGMEFGINHEMIFDLVSELRKLTNKLLIVKLSPNVTDIEKIAASSERAGADAISAINTLQGLAIDSKSGDFLLSTKFGGLSGPAIKPVALAKVFKVYNNVKIPIIGMGGISSVSDIVEFLRVGSTMVQIGTVNYRDPSLISKLYDQMLNFMNENNINKITDLTGDYK